MEEVNMIVSHFKSLGLIKAANALQLDFKGWVRNEREVEYKWVLIIIY
jgi:hypothetical protein